MNLLMSAASHANEGGGWLTLRACGHDDGFLGHAGVELIGGDEQAVRDAEITELRGETDVINHAAPDDAEPATMGGGGIRYLLDARDK